MSLWFKKLISNSIEIVLLMLTYCRYYVSSEIYVIEHTQEFTPPGTLTLSVSPHNVLGGMKHFWTNTGFCPPKPHNETKSYFFSDDMGQNLLLIGCLPYNGIRQVRIHWLLDLVYITGFRNGTIIYDFTELDRLMKLLFKNRLKPGFELMGNPSNYFTDFENATQVYRWADLVRQTAARYIDMFGINEVMGWNFETWNEPDCHDFDKLRMTKKGFVHYYDACSRGLRLADPRLRFGGPGDGCHMNKPNSYAFLLYDHVTNGRDFFTGLPGIRMDFLSLHIKGRGLAANILRSELECVSDIRQFFPAVSEKPFYNDEADPLVGWSKAKTWRADATYAALVAKVIAQHQKALISQREPPIDYSLLSNDNAFLSYYPHQFTQRTLLARFQINNTSPPHVEFIKKPVYGVMALLGMLGDRQVQTHLTDDEGHTIGNLADIGTIATLRQRHSSNKTTGWELTVVLYYCHDPGDINSTQTPDNPVPVNVHVDIPRQVFDLDAKVAVFSVDNVNTNPYSVWLKQHSPAFPTREQFAEMRRKEGPSLLALFSLKKVPLKLSVRLYHPQVLFIHICARTESRPMGVANLEVKAVSKNKVLVTWTPAQSRCVRGYDVRFQRESTSKAVTIGENVTSTSLTYDPVDSVVNGRYSARAVNYWLTPGPWRYVHY